MVGDGRHPRVRTGLQRERFVWLAQGSRSALGRTPGELSRRPGHDRSADPGSRCVSPLAPPPPEQALFPYLTRIRTLGTQADPESEFGAGRVSMSRYLDRAGAPRLWGIPPTARYMMGEPGSMNHAAEIRRPTPDFDGTVLVDGTRVRVRRPENAGGRRALYGGGKKKAATYNTAVYGTSGSSIIGTGRPGPSAAYGMTEFRIPSRHGHSGQGHARSLHAPRRGAGPRGRQRASGRRQALSRRQRLDAGKKPGNGRLAAMQKRSITRPNSKRMSTGHTAGDTGEYHIMQSVFLVGSIEQFGETSSAVTGLASLKKM